MDVRLSGIISIHFLYTEEDSSDSSPRASCTSFQSTSSIQRKTKARRTPHHKNTFQSTSSIQRKTILTFLRIIKMTYFNPLPLYRGRPQISTNEYPSSRHFISNFDIKAIILSTRFSKLSYV